MKPLLHHLGAFTILELLVVIGIVSIMMLAVLPNFRFSQRRFALQRSAHKLAQDIRRAQQMAMSAETSSTTNWEVPEGGYGIFFNTEALPSKETKYILYGDKDGNHEYDAAVDYLIEELEVEKGVFIKRPLDTEKTTKNRLFITFVPPDPKVYIVPPGEPEPDWARIIVALQEDIDQTKVVYVNKVGLINVE